MYSIRRILSLCVLLGATNITMGSNKQESKQPLLTKEESNPQPRVSYYSVDFSKKNLNPKLAQTDSPSDSDPIKIRGKALRNLGILPPKPQTKGAKQ